MALTNADDRQYITPRDVSILSEAKETLGRIESDALAAEVIEAAALAIDAIDRLRDLGIYEPETGERYYMSDYPDYTEAEARAILADPDAQPYLRDRATFLLVRYNGGV